MIKIVTLTGLIAALLITFEYNKKNNEQTCASLSFEQATQKISENYLEILKRWKQEKGDLGTYNPDIFYDRQSTQVTTDSYLVPFTAKGPSGIKKRFAILTCRNDAIEYSAQ